MDILEGKKMQLAAMRPLLKQNWMPQLGEYAQICVVLCRVRRIVLSFTATQKASKSQVAEALKKAVEEAQKCSPPDKEPDSHQD